MSRPPESPDDRLLELLADRALDGLSDAEMAELMALLDDTPGVAPDSLERVAASLALVFEPAEPKPLPGFLRSRVGLDADRYFGAPATARRRSMVPKLVAASGWIAAAASWLVTTVAFWPPPRAVDDRPAGPPPVGASTTTVGLRATEHPLAAGARGELVWDQAEQRGYLRLTGLADVDPSRGAYQLWIFDDRGDPRYPVDGGAFTIGGGAAPAVVPVKPLVGVGRPTLFAVTLEPPGGVVVSDRRRILLAGEVPGAPPGR